MLKSEQEKSVEYVHTTDFPELLRKLNVSLFVTTYQAQRLLVFSARPEKLFMLMRVFPRPTGLALNQQQMVLSSKHQLLIFERVYEIRNLEGQKEDFDFCFSPRLAHICGDVQGHEVAIIKGVPHFINTRFNSICVPSQKFSFEVKWKPKFISEIVPEDRCHLNGFAVEAEKIKYLTCLAKTNIKDQWREHKRDGGVIIDYANSEIVSSGLSMPHSPRLHLGALWVLNSGKGQLEKVDIKNGQRSVVAKLPGFLRGLTFVDNYAFVGLSLIREKKTFGGLEIEAQAKNLECAVYCIDLRKGSLAGFIRFTKGVEELFDIQVLPGAKKPNVIGFEEDTVDGLFVLP
jgi:uncharacterized protein (TIGR03032 family)